MAAARLGAIARGYEAMLQTPLGDTQVHNGAAWLRLFTGTDLRGGLDLARKAAGPSREQTNAALLNTIAVLEAELGELGAAKLDGWQAMANDGRTTPNGADWLIHGAIAEQLGLRDDAIADYRRVPRSSLPHGVSVLAQRRLARFGVSP